MGYRITAVALFAATLCVACADSADGAGEAVIANYGDTAYGELPDGEWFVVLEETQNGKGNYYAEVHNTKEYWVDAWRVSRENGGWISEYLGRFEPRYRPIVA